MFLYLRYKFGMLARLIAFSFMIAGFSSGRHSLVWIIWGIISWVMYMFVVRSISGQRSFLKLVREPENSSAFKKFKSNEELTKDEYQLIAKWTRQMSLTSAILFSLLLVFIKWYYVPLAFAFGYFFMLLLTRWFIYSVRKKAMKKI